MTTPPSELNRIAVDLDEAELWTLATIVRDYAALIKTYADDGMVRVPVEPNEGMMMAILNRGLGDPPDPAWIKVAKSRWAYLLEAAKGVTQLKGNRNEPGADV